MGLVVSSRAIEIESVANFEDIWVKISWNRAVVGITLIYASISKSPFVPPQFPEWIRILSNAAVKSLIFLLGTHYTAGIRKIFRDYLQMRFSSSSRMHATTCEPTKVMTTMKSGPAPALPPVHLHPPI